MRSASRTPLRALLAAAVVLVAAPITTGAGTAYAEPADGAATPSARKAPASLTIVGNGYGHGRGLSQWGAYYQAEAGRTHQQILRFYYRGLDSGTVGGNVKVLISADTTTDVVVRARSGLKVKSLGSKKTYALNRPGVRQWRILPADGGRRSAIAWRGDGGWRTQRTVPGEAQFTAGGRPITLVTPAGPRAYRGVLRSAAPSASSGARDTVNVVSLEDYLRGVVPREVPALWPQEAVRAQAVAARTYAAFERRQPLARHYQICDTASCQVYGGYTDEHPGSNEAIGATRGDVLTSGGTPAFTQFSASNGGWSDAGSQSYLAAREDTYDRAYQGWKVTISAATLQRVFPGMGAYRNVEVVSRDGNGDFGGRVERIRVVFADGATTVTGDDFRVYFGLRSTMFRKG